ncbi:hypothetical protein AGMMS50225_00870 [Betaproteobacteria bacterium]|nr:hypothetical protein AGMMS50225_00870 [Betaproteobacteria bacterium]
MALTDTAIRATKPGGKDAKLSDGGGLFLLVKATEGRWWRLSYRHGGKQKTLSMGVYPDIGLKDARERREAAKKLLAQGIDPGEDRKVKKGEAAKRKASTSEAVARDWFERWQDGKADPGKAWARLETYVFPWPGATPVGEITPVMVLTGLREHVEAVGKLDTLRKAKSYLSQIMRHAVQQGLEARDPCPDLRGAFKKGTVKHFAAITAPLEVGKLLRDIDGYVAIQTEVG